MCHDPLSSPSVLIRHQHPGQSPQDYHHYRLPRQSVIIQPARTATVPSLQPKMALLTKLQNLLSRPGSTSSGASANYTKRWSVVLLSSFQSCDGAVGTLSAVSHVLGRTRANACVRVGREVEDEYIWYHPAHVKRYVHVLWHCDSRMDDSIAKYRCARSMDLHTLNCHVAQNSMPLIRRGEFSGVCNQRTDLMGL